MRRIGFCVRIFILQNLNWRQACRDNSEGGDDRVDTAKKITALRERAGENRKEFSAHTGIPVRTLEDWEAGRRTPSEYIPRLIEYQLRYEEIAKKQDKN